MRRPSIPWPNNARVAVNFHLVLEQWAGPAASTGHGMTPNFPKELIEAGKIDWATTSWQDYGGRRGFYRLMDVLNEHGVKGSASISGLAADAWPDLVKEFVDNGHEPSGHCYSQEQRMFRMTPEEERADIRKCVETFERVTGVRPVGWGSPGGQRSDLTPRLLMEEGFIYSQDFRDDDVPYIAIEQDGKRLVAMPNTYEINDAVLAGRFGQPPSTYVEMFCRSFDRLYKEGQTEPKLLTAILHGTYYGRPAGGWAVDECIRYIRQFPDVWIAQRRDVAQWVLDQTAQR